MLYISMKFHNTTMNNFQRNYNCQFSKGNNSKYVQEKVMVLGDCILSDDTLYFCEVSWKYLNCFQVIESWHEMTFVNFPSYRADMILWHKQIDNQVKNNISALSVGGDKIRSKHI